MPKHAQCTFLESLFSFLTHPIFDQNSTNFRPIFDQLSIRRKFSTYFRQTVISTECYIRPIVTFDQMVFDEMSWKPFYDDIYLKYTQFLKLLLATIAKWSFVAKF